MRLQFEVTGRPPRKSGAKSCWASDEANYVLELRLKALEAKHNENLLEPITTSVRIKLTIFSPNITDRSNSQTYLGDLDTFIAGVFESLQPADSKVIPNDIFNGNDEIHPSKPLILYDDAQVVEVLAKKIKDGSEYYSVVIETLEKKYDRSGKKLS